MLPVTLDANLLQLIASKGAWMAVAGLVASSLSSRLAPPWFAESPAEQGHRLRRSPPSSPKPVHTQSGQSSLRTTSSKVVIGIELKCWRTALAIWSCVTVFTASIAIVASSRA